MPGLFRFCLPLFLLLTAPAMAGEPLVITGLGPAAKRISTPELAAIGLSEVKDTRDLTVSGETKRLEIRYGGVPLPALLTRLGIETLDRYALRSATILVVAKDGYRASFSWGELFNHPSGNAVMVITQENGTPNPAREGDFSLRAFSDLRPGPRHIRDVAEIRIELAPR